MTKRDHIKERSVGEAATETAATDIDGRTTMTRRRVRWVASALLASAVLPATVAAAPAVGTEILLQSEWCQTPFLGDLATWGTPKVTKALMLAGAGVVSYGLFGAPAEGRGRLSLRMALILGLLMFFFGFQWVPTWEYIGSIFGDGSIDAVTCGMESPTPGADT